MPRPTLNSRRPLIRRGRLLIIACGFSLTLFFCALSLNRPAFLAHFDDRFFDGLIMDDVPPKGYSGPVVVALDDDSMARFGRWPWPRVLVARLLTRISEQEPAGVGIDAIFAEQEHPLSGKKLSPSARKQTPGDLALAGGPFVSVSGYRGQQRLMALADAYDAVVSRRIYPHETVIRIIIEESGIQFDPVVVDAFLKAEKQWRQIASDLVDSDEVEVMAK